MAINHRDALKKAIETAYTNRLTSIKTDFAAEISEVGGERDFGKGSTACKKFTTGNIADSIALTLSEYDKAEIKAKSRVDALKSLLRTNKSLGQAILLGLWETYLEGDIRFLGADPEAFAEWARDTYHDDAEPKYIAQLAYVVTNIFQDVYARNEMGNPYTLPDTDEAVTVDKLIDRYGLVSRLIMLQRVFAATNRSDEEKQALLDAALNADSRDEVQAEINRLENDQIEIHLPYRAIPRGDGTTDVEMKGLSRSQFQLFQTLIGNAAELTF